MVSIRHFLKEYDGIFLKTMITFLDFKKQIKHAVVKNEPLKYPW